MLTIMYMFYVLFIKSTLKRYVLLKQVTRIAVLEY